MYINIYYVYKYKMSAKNFQQKMTNGKLNPKYVDLLSEDPPIPSQVYGCY